MADINITFAEVKEKSSALRQLNTNLTEKLGEIQTTINGLSQSWTSDTSETIRQKINDLKTKRFDEYQTIITEYADFLDKTVETYTTTETTLNNNLAAFE